MPPKQASPKQVTSTRPRSDLAAAEGESVSFDCCHRIVLNQDTVIGVEAASKKKDWGQEKAETLLERLQLEWRIPKYALQVHFRMQNEKCLQLFGPQGNPPFAATVDHDPTAFYLPNLFFHPPQLCDLHPVSTDTARNPPARRNFEECKDWVLEWGIPANYSPMFYPCTWFSRRFITQKIYGPITPQTMETNNTPELCWLRARAAHLMRSADVPSASSSQREEFLLEIELVSPFISDERGEALLERFAPMPAGQRIWRRFICPSNTKLSTLADRYISPIMGWERNSHGHIFTCVKNGAQFGPRKATTIDSLSHLWHYALYYLDDSEYAIRDIMNKEGESAVYYYDLGDCWTHVLRLKRIIRGSEAEESIIVDGAGPCPPENGSPTWLRNYLKKKEVGEGVIFNLEERSAALSAALRRSGFDLSQSKRAVILTGRGTGMPRSLNDLRATMHMRVTSCGYEVLGPRHADPNVNSVCSTCGSMGTVLGADVASANTLVPCVICSGVKYCSLLCAIRDTKRHAEEDKCDGHNWREAFSRRTQRREGSQAASSQPTEGEKQEKQGLETPSTTETLQQCIICLGAEPTHACVPCGHRHLCGVCANLKKIKRKCPLCRATVTSFIKIFL
jgi:hypothetical protein